MGYCFTHRATLTNKILVLSATLVFVFEMVRLFWKSVVATLPYRYAFRWIWPIPMTIAGVGMSICIARKHALLKIAVHLTVTSGNFRPAHQILKRDTLVPESETSPMRPALVNTITSTGAVAVVVSIAPFAPTFTSATEPSPPADQPFELRKSANASCVINRKMMAFDWAPA